MKKQEMNARFIVKVGITLLLIAALSASILAFVNSVTKDKIAENEMKTLKEIIERVYGETENIEKLGKKYEDPVDEVYEITADGEVAGYCVRVSPVGFKDDISIIVCADIKGKCLDVEIISISDTPGVGLKVKDQAYLDGYKGLDREEAPKYDTITGATISSSAVRRGVCAALSLDVFEDQEEYYEPEETTEREPVDPSEEPTETTDTPESTVEKKDRFKPRVVGTVEVTRRETTVPETTTLPPETTTLPPETTTLPPETTTGEAESTIIPEESKQPQESAEKKPD